MSVQLNLVESSILIYHGILTSYNAINLRRIPYNPRQIVITNIPLNTRFESHPLFIKTASVDSTDEINWAIVTSAGDRLIFKFISSQAVFNEPVIQCIRFLWSDFEYSAESRRVNRADLPDFDQELIFRIEEFDTLREATPIDTIQMIVSRDSLNRTAPEVPAPEVDTLTSSLVMQLTGGDNMYVRNTLRGVPEDIRSMRRNAVDMTQNDFSSVPEDTFQLTVMEAMVKRMYNLPLEMPTQIVRNHLPMEFIPLDQIQKMLTEDKIERFLVEPILQLWAGSPSTNNQIITFFAKTGSIYLVKARYDSNKNELLAPI